MSYQEQTLAVMNRVELVVALYDGMVRFLYRAIAHVEAGNVAGRRDSIRRVLEILTYLQARLQPDIGGEPAAALAEFYAAMYAQCVCASRDQSVSLIQQTIRDIRSVRDSWQQVAVAESATTEQARDELKRQQMLQLRQAPSVRNPPPTEPNTPTSSRWSA